MKNETDINSERTEDNRSVNSESPMDEKLETKASASKEPMASAPEGVFTLRVDLPKEYQSKLQILRLVCNYKGSDLIKGIIDDALRANIGSINALMKECGF